MASSLKKHVIAEGFEFHVEQIDIVAYDATTRVLQIELRAANTDYSEKEWGKLMASLVPGPVVLLLKGDTK